MKPETLFLAIACWLIVYWQSAFQGLNQVLGVQPDLLPSLVAYAALSGGLGGVVMVSVAGALLLDGLSANPLGVSIIPLLAAGTAIYAWRDFVLRNEPFAQAVLGAGAGALVPALTLLILLSRGDPPPLGWGMLWQFVVLVATSALATPIWFWVFGWLKTLLLHQRMPETTFRQDREIRRGRRA